MCLCKPASAIVKCLSDGRSLHPLDIESVLIKVVKSCRHTNYDDAYHITAGCKQPVWATHSRQCCAELQGGLTLGRRYPGAQKLSKACAGP